MGKELHDLSREELGRLFPIEIVEPDEHWPAQYRSEKARLVRILGPLAGRIEHIGSTAVPGLAAKPTIDILVEIPDERHAVEAIQKAMTAAGYIQMREQQDHLMFVKGYTLEGLAEQSVHIHMARRDQDAMWERVLFRDYLIRHPEAAEEYAKLKFELAFVHRYDRESYTEGKGDFVRRITERAKTENEEGRRF
jgi:GrpB-like predicted nucleotidyltransferase (UPF0157 family)